MATRRFAVTYDYRCPFARNVHEHVLDGLAEGADWEVRFVPFSLSAAKDPTWDPATDSGLTALEVGIAVRDTQPEHFAAAHRALFAQRHDRGASLRDLEVLLDLVAETGVDRGALLDSLASGLARKTVREEHEAAVAEHTVWGVPTFLLGDRAAFVRLMERPSDAEVTGAAAIERILDLLGGWPELNEFKHTALPR